MGTRKCSQCGNRGHNSRTCRNLSSTSSTQNMKLFGVELVNLPSSNHNLGFNNNSGFSSTNLSSSIQEHSADKLKTGYFFNGTTSQGPRKKGVPWSEEEHRLFLIGLRKLGKGNWRGIAKNFVTTRTSTQVASHAQKYFLRLQNNNNNNNATKNKFGPILLSMVGRNEAESVSGGLFSSASKDCNYSTRRVTPYALPQIPYNNNFRLMCNAFTPQKSPSLELSLSAPPPPPPSPQRPLPENRRPVVLWRKQYHMMQYT